MALNWTNSSECRAICHAEGILHQLAYSYNQHCLQVQETSVCHARRCAESEPFQSQYLYLGSFPSALVSFAETMPVQHHLIESQIERCDWSGKLKLRVFCRWLSSHMVATSRLYSGIEATYWNPGLFSIKTVATPRERLPAQKQEQV